MPRKNIREIGGVPLIGHAILSAQAASVFDAIVVSTDDQEIADVAHRFGAEVPFLRPAELAQDHSAKWPVFRHLVESWETNSNRTVGILVDLDVAIPLRSPEDIVGCLNALTESEADVAGTAYIAERNPYFNMVEIGPDGFAHLSKPISPPIVARQQAPPVFALALSVLAIRRDALWRYDHWSEAKFVIHEVPRERAVDVDTELDFRFVEFLAGSSGEK